MPLRRLGFALTILALSVTSCAAMPTLSPPPGQVALAADDDLSRFDSMQQLIAQSYLPDDEAGCVVDEVYFLTGSYNLSSPQAAGVDRAKVISDCTFDREYEPSDRESQEALDVEIQELEVETEVIERYVPVELTEEMMPAIEPGGMAVGIVELGGKTIEYVTITPQGFSVGDRAPVFFALPPGGQDLEIAAEVAAAVYAGPAARRGWVVVTPASPGGRWFDDDNTEVVPEMVDWINAWVNIEGGRPHLGGMSNGGISAFHIIAQDPAAFQSLLVYPGVPNTEADQAALSELAGVPIRMWVGGEDPDWLASSQTTFESLEAVGADVSLTVYPGEGHVIRSTASGIPIFDALESLR